MGWRNFLGKFPLTRLQSCLNIMCLITAMDMLRSKGYFLWSEVPCLSPHFSRLHTGEARPVPVWPPLESRQVAVLGRSARRNRASKWCQTLQTRGGDLDEQAESFWVEACAPCFICICCETPLCSTRRGTSSGRKYPFYPLISHWHVFTFPKHLHRFLRVRPVSYPFEHLSKVVNLATSRGSFGKVGAAQRSVQMAPNFADMWKRPGWTQKWFGIFLIHTLLGILSIRT